MQSVKSSESAHFHESRCLYSRALYHDKENDLRVRPPGIDDGVDSVIAVWDDMLNMLSHCGQDSRAFPFLIFLYQ